MNSNLFHNLLNLLGLLIGVLATYNWASLGLSASTTAEIVSFVLVAQNVVKLAVNISRDGVAGLAKPQPPVGTAQPGAGK